MDYSLLIGKYLSDKQELLDPQDNFNLALILAGDTSGWRFANIPCPTIEELEALN